MTAVSPIVFALDFTSRDEAARAAERVKSAVGMLKVGLELFVAEGPSAVSIGAACGLPVFLDLKLHDIPETVERSVARAAALGVRVLTVHASGGPTMLARAVKRAASEGGELAIAAVTVLTSLDERDLAKMGTTDDVASHAKRLAKMAWDEGVRTFVCSAHEVATMRATLGKDATLITPGIRPGADAGPREDQKSDDQKRVATAAKAASDGADWLVVGRPIRDAADPLAVATAMRDEARGAKRA